MKSKEKLLNHLVHLWNDLLHYSSIQSTKHEIDPTNPSKYNLLAYLAMQQFKQEGLNNLLINEGFTSLRHIHPHVLYSLNKMINYLSQDSCHFIEQPPMIQSRKARELKITRCDDLFGNRENDSFPIMVTLDRSMMESPLIFRELIEAGMTIARINCAHDNIFIWRQLVQKLKAEEHKINENAGKVVSNCKIYMDLAGPKIRIKEFIKFQKTLHIKRAGEIGYLAWNVDGWKHEDKQGTFLIHIEKEIDLQQLQPNSIIHFKDKDEKDCVFTVLEKVSPTCFKVKVNQPARLNDNTVLITENATRLRLINLQKKQVKVKLKQGECLRVYKSATYSRKFNQKEVILSLGITIPTAVKSVQVGDRMFIDDGKIFAKVVHVTDEFFDAQIVLTKKSTESVMLGKGLNLPDSSVYTHVSAITEADIETLSLIAPIADLIGISFVHNPADIQALRLHLGQLTDRKIGVIAKIETKSAALALANILLEGLKQDLFGVMIARGDLVVESGFEQFANVQEEILNLCQAAHLPVIWATGILEQLNKTGMPVRSELTDAYMGLRADCVMLNKGPHIVSSVKFLRQLHELNE